MRPLADHITWGTYGTRLHGDPRGTVDRYDNQQGTPVFRYDQHIWEYMKENLKYEPVRLTKDQMRFIESIIPSICEKGFWKYITCAAGPDHVHVLLTSEHDPEKIRRLRKRWITQALNEKWTLGPEQDRTWWSESGSIKWIDHQSYLANATGYVSGQRATSLD